jgi:hypothetical protein
MPVPKGGLDIYTPLFREKARLALAGGPGEPEPVTRDRFEYEFDVVVRLDAPHRAHVQKSRLLALPARRTVPADAAFRRQPGWVVRAYSADAPPKDFPVPPGTDAGAYFTAPEYQFGAWLLTHPDAAPAQLELRDPGGRITRVAGFPALDDA